MTELLNRRDFLVLGATAALGGSLSATAPASGRPRVAAIFTVLRFRSHAFNILENFLGPYLFRGQLTDPGVDVVALYADQFPDDDMAREVSQRFGIPLYSSIDEALCNGGRELAVDAVLAIGEHGDYPYDKLGRHMYPRKRFFDESIAVMKRANRFVPYFNDKHLSYRWDEADEIFKTARKHRMPLISGSSVPLAQRRPELNIPAGEAIEEAVSIHGGGLESYDFHALEVLQSVVESRSGGETGISRIQLLTGADFEKARQAGRWSLGLVDAAMKAEADMNEVRQPFPKVGVYAPSKKKSPKGPDRPKGPFAICIEYKDGLKATVLRLSSSSNRWNFACRLKGESAIRASALFNGPWANRCLFKALSHAIQHTFKTGREPYPADRTLMTTGLVDAVMQSWNNDGQVVETPHLELRYQTSAWNEFRENGDTWKIITKETPQPVGFEPRSFSELPN